MTPAVAVTPAEVKAAWDATPGLSQRKTAEAVAAQMSISATLVRQWKRDDFDPEKIEARNMATAAAKAQRVARDRLEERDADTGTDGDIIRRAARKGMVTAITFFGVLKKDAHALIKANPREVGSLLRDVSRSMKDATDIYEKAITLAERALKLSQPEELDAAPVAETEAIGDGAPAAPAPMASAANDHHEPLEDVLVAFRRAAGKAKSA